jgi:hypothetical protein
MRTKRDYFAAPQNRDNPRGLWAIYFNDESTQHKAPAIHSIGMDESTAYKRQLDLNKEENA